MRAPKWSMRKLSIFVTVVLAYALVLGAFAMDRLDDGSFSIQDFIAIAMAVLIPLMVVTAAMLPWWGAGGTPSSQPLADDQPTAAVGRTAVVMPFQARRRFKGAVYRAGDAPPLRTPLQSGSRDGVPSADEAAGFVRGLLAAGEDTSGSGLPPVPRWGEEAT